MEKRILFRIYGSVGWRIEKRRGSNHSGATYVILNSTERIPSDRNLTGFFGPSIIPYQELRGDYNSAYSATDLRGIIPYQELRGDYNDVIQRSGRAIIIPYQELRGHMTRF